VPTLEAIGFDYVRPYHLRHSAICLWIREGSNVVEVAKRAGHTPEVCLSDYARAFEVYVPGEQFRLDYAIRAARDHSGVRKMFGAGP